MREPATAVLRRMTRFARLPWYDLPEMHAANDAVWRAIAGELAANNMNDIPSALDRGLANSRDDDACLFTQTCGYPLLTTARDRFTVLGAPRYDVPGCTDSRHRSFIVVRDDADIASLEDLRGARFAVNEANSNSGMNLPRRLFAPLARNGRFVGRTVLTGSHAASAALVGAGGADAAAIDCVTFAFLQRYRPGAVSALRVIAETAESPAPPLGTSRETDARTVAALRRALRRICSEPAYRDVREQLFLVGIDECDADAYAVVLAYERDARNAGYPELR